MHEPPGNCTSVVPRVGNSYLPTSRWSSGVSVAHTLRNVPGPSSNMSNGSRSTVPRRFKFHVFSEDLSIDVCYITSYETDGKPVERLSASGAKMKPTRGLDGLKSPKHQCPTRGGCKIVFCEKRVVAVCGC